ncbi:MAG: PSD1 and planctomycete cytochrome C domain-containing protein [Aureliella sp.]
MTTARALFVLISAVAIGGPGLRVCAGEAIDYSRDVRPLLSRHCYVCHGPDEGSRQAGLRLDRADAALAEGDSGSVAIVPGDADASELIRRVTATDDALRMPPPENAHALSKAEINTLRRWIEAGAKFDDHWAFRPVARPRPPKVNDQPWCRNPVDQFILAKLETSGHKVSPEADRATLIRRLSLDLTGLPPSAEEVAAFVADRSADAYEQAVERLLASPRFGERWSRHWLDLAHYADSDGYLGDALRPHAWHYRDWVIDAINRDLPFDQFTIEQLSGDLLPRATTAQKTATGFLRNTLRNTEAGVDLEEYRLKEITDRVSTLGATWLGLSLGCAECHSHKYDPISQREFYQLFAFFNDADDVDLAIASDVTQQVNAGKKNAEKTNADKSKTEKPTAEKPTAKRSGEDKKPAAVGKVMTIARRKSPRKTYVHLRGDYRSPGDEVTKGTPAVLPSLNSNDKPADRLELARWLVDPANPLTPRVTVNYWWQHLFGTGLVATVDNFGLGGDSPSHPELLDWLASELVARRWGRKDLVRMLVCSSTYRQSSTTRDDLADVDPLNRWLARQSRLRLEAETIRDAALKASGLLDTKIGGPSIRPPQPAYITSISRNVDWPVTEGGDLYRRGLYILLRRATPYPMLLTFDAPDSTIACTRRERSNSPLQALTLLNDPVFFECAQALGSSLAEAGRVSGASLDQQLTAAFRRCLTRDPRPEELTRLERLFREQAGRLKSQPELARTIAQSLPHAQASDAWRHDGGEPIEVATWVVVARVLMITDEFITRE